MTVMTSKKIVHVLGAFGDGRDHVKEEAFPLITTLHPKEYSTKMVDSIVRRYAEYQLLKVRKGESWKNEIAGHPYISITTKGEKALDHYRDMWSRSLEHDPDKLSSRGIRS